MEFFEGKFLCYNQEKHAFLFKKKAIKKVFLMEVYPQMDTRLFGRVVNKKKQVERLGALSWEKRQQLHRELRIEFTYHSTTMEGNTLTLAEMRSLLEDGMAIGNHPLREYLEVVNHAEAFDLLDQYVNADISLTTVLKLHALVMDKIIFDAGQLRAVQVYVGDSSYVPPPPHDVSLYMMQWLRWLGSDEAFRYEAITRVALAHHQFEAMHPFADGNGRVGRLLMNLMLMRYGYPPALLLRSWRTRYIEALQAGHRGDYSDLINLVGLAVEQSMDRYLEAHQIATVQLQPLKELAQLFDLDNNYLGQLARLGKIEATRKGSFWYSSQKAVETYLHEVQMQPRGRRSKRALAR
jgi:Fic family protein